MTDIKLSEEQWREKLTPEQFEVCRCSATEAPFTGSMLIAKRMEYISVVVVGKVYLIQPVNIIQVRAGLVFRIYCLKILLKKLLTVRMGCVVLKLCAVPAMHI